ncbi:putative chloride channel-like protein CLC-g [Hordeum vulgare]|nr:putative chloride channel-like protein CLC-g [Hordeum vulgare]
MYEYKHVFEEELAKLKKEKDHLRNEYHKMVYDVPKMFDWQDGVRKVDYPKAMDADKFDKKKEELEMEIQVDSDLIAQEKKELDLVVANLLNAGHGSKEKLEKIKAILEA